MSSGSGIEWTETTWNPVTGCDRVSPGCDNCYALTLAKRLKAMGTDKYQKDGDPRTSGPGFGVAVHEDVLLEPLRWRKPRRVFVNSMSDLFHAGVPDEYITRVWAVMALAGRHTFQVLTKRHGRMRSLLSSNGFQTAVFEEIDRLVERFPKLRERAYQGVFHRTILPLNNVWLGVSVENQKWADIRVPALLETPAAIRFLSCEPLLGPVALHRYLPNGFGEGALHNPTSPSLDDRPGFPTVDWVIVGGESGPAYRRLDLDWVREVRDRCQESGVPLFFKQVGGARPKSGGRLLDGRTWDEFPTQADATSYA